LVGIPALSVKSFIASIFRETRLTLLADTLLRFGANQTGVAIVSVACDNLAGLTALFFDQVAGPEAGYAF